MPMIYVRTKEGRKAFYEGRVIPHDKFIPVTDDKYMRRLIDHWGDVEVQEGGGEQQAPAPKRAPQRNPQAGRPPAPSAAGQVEGRPAVRHAAAPTQAQPLNPAPGTGAPKPQA